MKLGTRRKKIFVFLALMPAMILFGKAQSGIALYSFEDQYNSSDFNPAFLFSPSKFTLSIFPAGGSSIGYNNQQIIRNIGSSILSGNASDNDYIEVMKSMSNRSSFNQNAEGTLLSFTYRSKLGFFNFRIKENESFIAAFKGDLSNFIMKSGIQSAIVNQVQKLPAQAMHYREYSLGYSLLSRQNRFSAGIRAKLYFGKASFFSDISGSILTDQMGQYAIQTGGKAYLSFPEFSILNQDGTINNSSAFTSKKIVDYLMNSGNPGLGVDLGIKYRITSDLTLAMSVIDLGTINWNSNLNSKSFNGTYVFETGSIIPGYNDAGIPIITKTDSAVTYVNSISEIFDLVKDSSAFSRPMPLTIYTSIKYKLNSSLKISLMNRYVILKDINYNSFSITANYDLNKKVSVNTGYAIIGNSYNNIPLAFLFRKDFGQIYIGTDNLVAFFAPSISEYASFTFGTCFYLFKNRTQHKTTTDDFPFYHPRRAIKNKRRGLILQEDSEF